MGKGCTFYFVRHGETYFNRYMKMQGWSNTPLTKDGRFTVIRSGRGLSDIRFDA
ncbi:MAG: histidine phosphatase family protein, partial [Carnobacterium maltaromaticum]